MIRSRFGGPWFLAITVCGLLPAAAQKPGKPEVREVPSHVSCSFGTFESTWLYKPHCDCGYLPGLLQVADMPGLAGLIAPRRLIVVAGKHDYLARFDGVEQGGEIARRCFSAAGHAERIILLAADGGHQVYPELAWPVIQKTLADLGD